MEKGSARGFCPGRDKSSSCVRDSNRIRTLDCYVSIYKKTKLEGPSSVVCTEGSHIPEPSPLSRA